MTKKENKGSSKIVHLQNPVEEELPSVYDVTFTFGTMPLPEKKDTTPDPVVRIRMSPQHAKVFSKILVKHIDKYEEDIGNIPIATALLKELGLE
jgi:hypothetical protein